MQFAFFALDRADSSDLRDKLRPDHLQFLKANVDRIVFAGPLLSADEKRIGSLLIIEAEDLTAAQQFFERDPYTKDHLFGEIKLLGFEQAIPAR